MDKNLTEVDQLRKQLSNLTAVVETMAGRAFSGAADVKGPGKMGAEVLGDGTIDTGGSRKVEDLLVGVTCEDGGSSGSWADGVEQDLFSGSEDSVTLPGAAKAVGEGPVLVFGGAVSEGFFAQNVRTPEVKALNVWLRKFGVKVSKRWLEELSLARYAQGTVPACYQRGRERLRTLAKVGDNVMTLVLTDQLYYEGNAVGDVQMKCGQILGRSVLSAVSVQSGLAKHISFPANIDIKSGSSAGEALEAIAGVVYHSQGIEGVKSYMRALQLIK